MTESEVRKKYLGVPFQHQGRSISGLDCYGLIINVYKDLGFELLDIEEDYPMNWVWEGRNYFIENHHKQWERVDVPKPFDVVLFYMNGKKVADHGGIVLSNNDVLHACKSGTVVSRLDHMKFLIEGFYHFKGL
ncbi:MAG: C40 family peptidase [Candidatus Omnitrophica bacterium]|nr:C40 family peptidase [Candidatus Omnitrophota bacterium]